MLGLVTYRVLAVCEHLVERFLEVGFTDLTVCRMGRRNRGEN